MNKYRITNPNNNIVRDYKSRTTDWDTKGNMIFHDDKSISNTRYLCWTEDNRLQAVKDNQMGAYYNYDASGERNLKLTGAVVQMSQNGVPYDYVMLESPTLYASGLITINERGYTKHYFEENKRVCSNIGGGFRYAGYDIMDSIELITPFLEQWRNAKDGIFKTFEQCIKSPVDLENTQEKIVKVMKNHEKNRNEEEYQFYYTNDHLGSSTYITNKEGQITQTLAYLPYGEDWIDLDNQPPYLTSYKFNGKEKDQETGYNYYGARYYNDKLSIWLSVDPMSDKYPHLTSYNYCANNPVMLIDPDGRDIVVTGEASDKYVENLQSKNVTITRNSETGLLTHSYNEGANYENISKEERMLVDAITSPEVTTNIVAGISKDNGKDPENGQSRGTFTWDDGKTYGTYGGSFMGTKIDKRDKNGKPIHVQTYSYVDPAMLDKEGYNQGAPHEATEGYKVGLISLKRNKDADMNSNIYKTAHKKAIPATYTSNYLFGIKINSKSPFKNVK